MAMEMHYGMMQPRQEYQPFTSYQPDQADTAKNRTPKKRQARRQSPQE